MSTVSLAAAACWVVRHARSVALHIGSHASVIILWSAVTNDKLLPLVDYFAVAALLKTKDGHLTDYNR